jgi:hypothetical protein
LGLRGGRVSGSLFQNGGRQHGLQFDTGQLMRASLL